MEVVFTLYVSEIVYEVQNVTYMVGKSCEGDYERVANVQMGDEDEEMNFILRSVGNAVEGMKQRLACYLRAGDMERNNRLMDKKNIVIRLMLPENYNVAMNDGVCSGMHEYVVNCCLGDWFGVFLPEEGEKYRVYAMNNLEGVRSGLNKRVKATRRRLSPW